MQNKPGACAGPLSKKRVRDAAIIADLRRRDEAFFQKLGIPRAKLEQAQLGLVGNAVFPGDPGYDTEAERGPFYRASFTQACRHSLARWKSGASQPDIAHP